MAFANVLKRLADATSERQRGMTADKVIVNVQDLKELLEQFGTEDRFSRRIHADNEKLKDEKLALSRERDALAAQVEALIAHGTALATAASMATGAMSIGSPVTEFCVEAVKRFNTIKEATPQQHLREIQADAGRAGYFRGHMDAHDNASEWSKKHSERHANEYAAKVRQGEPA